MTLEEIREATLSLYLDPDPAALRACLTDALSDLPQPRTWDGWLVESQTLDRLAELMIFLLEGEHLFGEDIDREDDEAFFLPVTEPLRSWLTRVANPEWLGRLIDQGTQLPDDEMNRWYSAVCGAMGVPPLRIQLEIPPSDQVRERTGVQRRWILPKPAIAAAALREAVRLGVTDLLLEGISRVVESVSRPGSGFHRYLGFRYRFAGETPWRTVTFPVRRETTRI